MQPLRCGVLVKEFVNELVYNGLPGLGWDKLPSILSPATRMYELPVSTLGRGPRISTDVNCNGYPD